MNRQAFADYMEQLFKTKIQKLREEGQKEYAHDEDNAFANFERAAQALGLSREQVWAVYTQKHWDGIVAHIAGHRSQREPVQGRIQDMIVYLFLFHAMADDADGLEAKKPKEAPRINPYGP